MSDENENDPADAEALDALDFDPNEGPSVDEPQRPDDFDWSAYSEESRNILQAVDRLPDEYRAKWDEFVDLLNEAVEHVFGTGETPETRAAVVIGVQFGEMGQNDDLPTCIGSSNLPPCHALGALDDLVDFVEAQHEDMHRKAGHGDQDPVQALLANLGVAGDDGPLMGPVSLDTLPEEAQAKVRQMMEQMGLDPAQVTVIGPANMDDLNELDETDEPERSDETEDGSE